MIICRTKDYQDLSRKAANIIRAQVILKPDCVLGLATGSSPVGTYQNLVKWYQKGDLDFSNVSSINLDEYRGLRPDNDQSYRYFMDTNLFNHINIDKSKTFVPNGLEEDSQKACDDYDQIIETMGGVDLQLLGLGHNGHIGFNEPDVPRQAYTMGIRSIMLAKKIVMVVSGEDKAEILKNVVNGPITPQVPASVLQLHRDVVIVADEAALSKF